MNVLRIYFAEIPQLAEHGITLPPNMQGLTAEQLVDLKLVDEWEDKCIPSGGAELKKDDIGLRNGQGERMFILLLSLSFSLSLHAQFHTCVFPLYTAPNDKMKDVLKKTMEEAKALVSKVSSAHFKPQHANYVQQ